MKKNLFIAAAALSMITCFSAFAGSWQSDANGWWYDNGNGTYPAGQWEWIDGNSDGVAECYYFDQHGYCLINTSTPDGYQVNENGAWKVDGQIQTRTVSAASGAGAVESAISSTPRACLLDMEPSSAKTNVYAHKAFYKLDNIGMRYGMNWDDAHMIMCQSAVDFYLGGQYNKLSITFAPYFNTDSSRSASIKLYNKDTGKLLKSTTVHYDSSPKHLDVNLSGVEYLRIVVGNGDDWCQDIMVV